MRILGKRTAKCVIILKWKKCEMRAWIGFVWLKVGTVEAFFLRSKVTFVAASKNRLTSLEAEKFLTLWSWSFVQLNGYYLDV